MQHEPVGNADYRAVPLAIFSGYCPKSPTMVLTKLLAPLLLAVATNGKYSD